jgi:UDP-N-acetylmuramate: L-alanyl-gamma-D-glutamyl-meso-diaminopimelate ligase
MRLGAHQGALPAATEQADRVLWYQPPDQDWGMQAVAAGCPVPAAVFSSTDAIINELLSSSTPDDSIVIMSNGGFEGLHRRLLGALRQQAGVSS